MIAAAQNLPMILIGRFLQGFAAAGYSPSIWVREIFYSSLRLYLPLVIITMMEKINESSIDY